MTTTQYVSNEYEHHYTVVNIAQKNIVSHYNESINNLTCVLLISSGPLLRGPFFMFLPIIGVHYLVDTTCACKKAVSDV